MTWLLCPRCLSWVAARAGTCPLCAGDLDPAAPDVPADELAGRLGPVTGCVGEVVVAAARRRGLPDRGLLLTTAAGLFFLPHRPEVVIDPGEAPSPGVGALWSLAGLTVGPAALVIPAVRWLGFGGGPRRRVVFEPRDYRAGTDAGGGGTGENGTVAALAEHLMADPGAFFLARGDVRLIRRAGLHLINGRPARGWAAECVGRPPVRWRALSDPAGVGAAPWAAGRSGVWHGAVV